MMLYRIVVVGGIAAGGLFFAWVAVSQLRQALRELVESMNTESREDV